MIYSRRAAFQIKTRLYESGRRERIYKYKRWEKNENKMFNNIIGDKRGEK